MTLITRPRRFGKILNMSRVEYFFSVKYSGLGTYFEGLNIWKNDKLRKLQEAYVSGHWGEFTAFIRSIFNSTFKTNQYLERGLLTGITRVSKESIFSDLNNLEVVTTTSEKYSSSFSFREGQQGQEKSQKHRPHWKGDSK